ncbi:MAG: hypothetical protein WC657_00700 [Candidatus Paceibacterota bacterium]|jgi:hypothetical protein
MGIEDLNKIDLPENLAKIKEKLLRGGVGSTYETPEIEGCEVKTMYDTGNEPSTGTTRDDEVIIKLTEENGNVVFAKLEYFHRNGEIHGLEFVTEEEANKFIEEQREYFKPYWEEKK